MEILLNLYRSCEKTMLMLHVYNKIIINTISKRTTCLILVFFWSFNMIY